jgi:hypothetical protein
MLARPSEAEHVTVVVDYLECAQSVRGVFQMLVHGNGSADVLFVQRVGVGGVDVGVPSRPFVARMIRLRMNLRGNRLEHHHDAVTPDHRPEILRDPVASALVLNFKPDLGLIELEARLKVVDNKERNNAVEGRHGRW